MESKAEPGKGPYVGEPDFIETFRDLARRKQIAANHIFAALARWSERRGLTNSAVPFETGKVGRG